MMKKILTGLFSVVLTLCLLLASVPALAAGDAPAEVPDFTLTDQYGNEHTLSDYQGKYVFLNFFATWCGPCQAEMPDFEELYHEAGENQGDLIILGIAAPGTDHEVPECAKPEDIAAFLEEMNITYPVLMDTEAALFNQFITVGYPTSLFIGPDGSLVKTEVGMIDKAAVLSGFGIQ